VNETNSYRTILRSSSIMGAASVANILFGLLRMKALALLLGPAGVGLFGLYQNLVSTGATISALGFGTVGTRQIAEANASGNDEDIAATRRALFWGTLLLAIIGTAIFFILRGYIANNILANPETKSAVGWLAIGLCLTVMAGSQTALLNGLRRIGDLARIQVASGLIGTSVGVAALWQWPASGALILVLINPIANFMLGHWYVAKLKPVSAPATPLRIMARQWAAMVQLGVAFMFSALVTGLGQLAVRTLVQHQLGTNELGHFQAAWNIGMVYLTFVLGAMATDYYPRLSACIKDKPAACRLINEQTEIAMLLAGPIILALIATAPWVMWLLYSADFAPAANILRWQLLGDIPKVLSWPLGFALLAAGAGKTFIVTESLAIGVFVGGVCAGLGGLGVQATGVAFLAMYVVYLPAVLWVAKRRLNFKWPPNLAKQAACLGAAALLIVALSQVSNTASSLIGLILAAGFALQALAKLGEMATLNGPVGKLAKLGKLAMEVWGIK
jgi:O-antigen/teichoic acid export membrane protein